MTLSSVLFAAAHMFWEWREVTIPLTLALAADMLRRLEPCAPRFVAAVLHVAPNVRGLIEAAAKRNEAPLDPAGNVVRLSDRKP